MIEFPNHKSELDFIELWLLVWFATVQNRNTVQMCRLPTVYWTDFLVNHGKMSSSENTLLRTSLNLPRLQDNTYLIRVSVSPLKFVVYHKLPKNLPAWLLICLKLFQALSRLKLWMFVVTPYTNVIFITGDLASVKQSTFIKSGFGTKVTSSTLHLNGFILSIFSVFLRLWCEGCLDGSVTEINQIMPYTLRQSKFNLLLVKMDSTMCGFCTTCNLLCLISSSEVELDGVYAQTH